MSWESAFTQYRRDVLAPYRKENFFYESEKRTNFEIYTFFLFLDNHPIQNQIRENKPCRMNISSLKMSFLQRQITWKKVYHSFPILAEAREHLRHLRMNQLKHELSLLSLILEFSKCVQGQQVLYLSDPYSGCQIMPENKLIRIREQNDNYRVQINSHKNLPQEFRSLLNNLLMPQSLLCIILSYLISSKDLF